jgi:ribosomal protein S8
MKTKSHFLIKALIIAKTKRKQLIFFENTKYKRTFLLLLWNYNYLSRIIQASSFKLGIFIKPQINIDVEINSKARQHKNSIKYKDIWILHLKNPHLNIIYSTIKGLSIFNKATLNKTGGYIIY